MGRGGGSEASQILWRPLAGFWRGASARADLRLGTAQKEVGEAPQFTGMSESGVGAGVVGLVGTESRTCGKWNVNTDLGTARRLGEDSESASDQAKTFRHANQAEAALSLGALGIESRPGIGNTKIDTTPLTRKFDFSRRSFAMFHDVS